VRIYLASKTNITKFRLETEEDDFFSYSYISPGTSESFLITFEKKDNKWYVKSNGSVNVYDGTTSLNSMELVEYKNCTIKLLGQSDLINIWPLPDKKKEEYALNVSSLNELTIGSNETCNICFKNSALAPTQIVIKKVGNDNVVSVVQDSKYYSYLNNSRITSNKKIYAGDTIFANGFKLIWMKNFIIINNPNTAIKVTNMSAYQDFSTFDNSKVAPVSDEASNIDIYTDESYFYHTPRIKEVAEEQDFDIVPPPGSAISEDIPWYLKLGTSITMGASCFVMSWSIFTSLSAGRGIKSVIPQIVMVAAMLLGTFLFPKLLANYQKKRAKAKEEKRITKYTEYLDKKEKEIELAKKRYIQIVNENKLPSIVCKNIALTANNRNFWSREISDNEFMDVRLGLGTIENPIKIKTQISEFVLDEDILQTKLRELIEKNEKLNGVPISLSLTEKNISAFICTNQQMNPQEYFKNIMVQLVALQSAADLKIAIFTNEQNAKYWEYAKMLPHCWSEDKSFRYFATNIEETKELSAKLQEEMKYRKSVINGKEALKDHNDETVKIDSTKGYKNFSTYFLIVCDCYKNNLRIPIAEDILSNKEQNLGFSFSIISNSLKNLPSECDTFIETGGKDGCILERNISSKNQQAFLVECDNDIDMNAISRRLLNIPLVPKEGLSVLPQSLSFLEMYGVSKIEQLNILNRWRTNNPVVSLSAPIGVYSSGDIFKLNLHEKFHGPHGLIAGTTGSGKSEFIITYILSMCVNYHPYEVQFVLIDYKGGGLAGAFENRELGTRIPHLAGTITNLDTASMNRTLVSIQSELTRRQQIFNQTRDSLGEGTVDIYKYQKFYREGIVDEPLPHLFIISDEFAELKSQQPEFMDNLISTARIGRSLGVHLILATQKPSGVVNNQIWSNSKFKVCLKVQDRGDSMEVLKKPDAASIKEAGRFYLQVGNDDFYDKGQSGWSGAKYVPSDKIIKKNDDSLSFVNNTGDVYKSIKDIVKVETDVDYGDQLTNIVKYINTLSEKEKIVTNKLWLDAIPEEIFINNLKQKYNYNPSPYAVCPIIGEYDSPSTQSQGLLIHDFVRQGNILIAGKQGSGKENFITTLILSSTIDHTPDEVNFYIIDCGTESMQVFSKMPHVGAVALQDDVDLVGGILNLAVQEIEIRKTLMADYAGSYEDYIKDSGKKLPIMVFIINNYDVFSETYSKFTEGIVQIFRDGPRYGITFVVSEIAPNAIRGRIAQNFTTKYILQQADDAQYRTDFDAPRGLIPSRLFGRGLVLSDRIALEFQTAYLVKKNEINSFIREASTTYNQAYTSHAKKIPVVPQIVYDNKLYEQLTDLRNVPIGFNIDTKMEEFYDFSQNQFTSIVTNRVTDDRMSFMYALIKMINSLDKVNVEIIDFADSIEKDIGDIKVYNNDYKKAFVEINNSMLKNKDKDFTTVYFFMGIGMYKTKVDPEGKELLNAIFSRVGAIENAKFIIMDTLPSFKNLQVDAWYQANVNTSCGIWLDADASSQLIINAPNLTVEDRKLNFPQIGFTIVNNNHHIIKHMVEYIDENTKEENNNEK